MKKPVRVKFVAKGNLLKDSAVWRRQLPDSRPAWGHCEFIFDPDEPDYDWLVAYDDLPPGSAENQRQKARIRTEVLACPREHTIFITAEPSSIKVYSRDFLNQFGTILTSQEPWAAPHPNVIFSQPALRWFYGVPFDSGQNSPTGLDALTAMEVPDKPHVISTVCSNKRMTYTTHSRRYDFVQELKARLPELEVFGRGVREINDKAMALDDFKYHIAIENHVCQHHWTEKLADAFLGYTLPFYYGAPNAAEYFPQESFIPIDIYNPEEALHIIRSAIDNGEYEKRLPAIIEARRRILEKYNIFAVINDLITRLNTANPRLPGSVILSRHALRRSSVVHFLGEMRDRFSVRLKRHSASSRKRRLK